MEDLNFICKPKDFNIRFYNGEGGLIELHIPFADAFKAVNLLNEFLQSKGIKSWVVEKEK